MSKRLTADDYRALAAERGYTWLDQEVPQSNKTKTRWQCPQGHEWLSSYTDFNQGTSCRQCSNKRRGRRRITPDQVAKLAESRDFKWIGKTHPYALEPTDWQCSVGHTWKACYSDLKKGNGCPHCSGNAPLTAGDYARVAHERGFIWLGLLPNATHVKTRWQCPQGHVWEAPYRSIAHNKSGCPHCKYERLGAKRKNKTDKYHALATRRGFKWVGAEVRNTKIKTAWECPSGHRWDSNYLNILHGNGCPHCLDYVNDAPVSKPQRTLHEQIGGELNYPVRRYRLDIAFPAEMIDVEYDCWYWHDPKRDAKRDTVLIALGWKILRIKSSELLPTSGQVQAALDCLRKGGQYAEIVLTDWKETE